MGDYVQLGIQYIFQEWNKSIELLSPPSRTQTWLLMESPFIPLGICGIYLALIFHFQYGSGNHDSVDLNDLKGIKVKSNTRLIPCLHFYNVFNVLTNFIIASGLTWVIITNKYAFACHKVQDDGSILAPLFIYLFHISKIVELGDTAFIIARGKKRQLTFLHVYHHTTILCATWMGARVVPGGTTAIISMINCWIHVIMYSYYNSKTKVNPSCHHKETLIFKKLLTIVQILQFVTTIWICLMTLQWPCGYPSWIATSLILYMLTFVLLFGHFYVATYV